MGNVSGLLAEENRPAWLFFFPLNALVACNALFFLFGWSCFESFVAINSFKFNSVNNYPGVQMGTSEFNAGG